MSAPADSKAFTACIRDHLDSIDCPEWQLPFHFARALQKVGAAHSRRFKAHQCGDWINWFADKHELDRDDFAEDVFLAWDRVKSVVSPVEQAHTRALETVGELLPGRWGPLRLHNRCTVAHELCKHLSQDGTAPFFLSCRDLGRVMNIDHNRAAGILRLLCERGFLKRTEAAAARLAQGYTWQKDDTETQRHRDTETQILRDTRNTRNTATQESAGLLTAAAVTGGIEHEPSFK